MIDGARTGSSAPATDGTGAAPGLRERKRRRTRHAIEDAAVRLSTERGFDAVTVEEIAAAADVSPRTFFHHFRSKEDAVLAELDDRLARLGDELARRPADEAPLAAVRAALLTVADDYEQARDRLLPRVRLIATTPSVSARSLQRLAHVEDVVADVLAGRLGVDVATDLRPRLVATATLGALRVAQGRWLAGGGTTSLPSHVTEALDLLADGLAPPT